MRENDEIVGEPLDEEDIFYLEWGQESVRSNLQHARDTLKQLLTLNAGLMGGGVVFLEEARIGRAQGFVLSAFFIALVLAFVGVLPYEGKVNLDSPTSIRDHKRRALAHKRAFIWASGLIMLIGFATAGAALAGHSGN